MRLTIESIILLEMLKFKKLGIEFNFKTQTAVRSRANFCRFMETLEIKNLAAKHFRVNGHRYAFFTLTYSGEFLAIWYCQEHDTPPKYRDVDKRDLVRMIM